MPGFVMCARHVRKLTGASPEIRCGAKIIAKIKVYIVRCRLKEDLAKSRPNEQKSHTRLSRRMMLHKKQKSKVRPLKSA